MRCDCSTGRLKDEKALKDEEFKCLKQNVGERVLPARENLERHFASHPDTSFTLNATVEVESRLRVVDRVARGSRPAIVNRFRAAFLPSGIIGGALVDGPKPLTASVYTRRKVVLEGLHRGWWTAPVLVSRSW